MSDNITMDQAVETEFSQAPQPTVTPTVEPDPGPQIDVESLIARNQQLEGQKEQVIGEKRKVQEKLRRQEEQTQQILNGIGQLLGMETETQDPKELARQVGSLQDQIQRAEVEKRAMAASYRNGVDPDIAVPVLQSQGKLNNIDFGEPGAEEALNAAIGELVTQYPNLVSPNAAQGQVVRPASQVAPTPSGATTPSSVVERYNQILAGGDQAELASFVQEHGEEIFGNYNPGNIIVG